MYYSDKKYLFGVLNDEECEILNCMATLITKWLNKYLYFSRRCFASRLVRFHKACYIKMLNAMRMPSCSLLGTVHICAYRLSHGFM